MAESNPENAQLAEWSTLTNDQLRIMMRSSSNFESKLEEMVELSTENAMYLLGRINQL